MAYQNVTLLAHCLHITSAYMCRSPALTWRWKGRCLKASARPGRWRVCPSSTPQQTLSMTAAGVCRSSELLACLYAPDAHWVSVAVATVSLKRVVLVNFTISIEPDMPLLWPLEIHSYLPSMGSQLQLADVRLFVPYSKLPEYASLLAKTDAEVYTVSISFLCTPATIHILSTFQLPSM